MDLKGYAVGGLAVGEPQEVMLAMLDTTMPGTFPWISPAI
jgi:queuine tRNA-ribosyltransferase